MLKRMKIELFYSIFRCIEFDHWSKVVKEFLWSLIDTSENDLLMRFVFFIQNFQRTSLKRRETNATFGAKSSRPGFIHPCKSNSLDKRNQCRIDRSIVKEKIDEENASDFHKDRIECFENWTERSFFLLAAQCTKQFVID